MVIGKWVRNLYRTTTKQTTTHPKLREKREPTFIQVWWSISILRSVNQRGEKGKSIEFFLFGLQWKLQQNWNLQIFLFG